MKHSLFCLLYLFLINIFICNVIKRKKFHMKHYMDIFNKMFHVKHMKEMYVNVSCET